MLPIEQAHPIAVHFPIVFGLTLALFDAVIVARGRTIASRGGTADVSAALAVAAALGAGLAYLFGDIALDVARAAGVAGDVLETHEELGEWTAILLMLWGALRAWLWWRRGAASRRVNGAIVVVQFALAALLVVTAYYGGQLVYEHGVAVVQLGAR